ncbi:DUF397 domain-containing protein [Actinomadura adrarensis]|uniref:DUF397 domain-containing protein n=1 Tax=Actinomadura adrarensis TaxID=1819600 RepID=A0ABW3CM08_9ACTN
MRDSKAPEGSVLLTTPAALRAAMRKAGR